MALTVNDTLTDAQRANPTLWPVPQMPDVPVEPWEGVPGQFWTESCFDRQVDFARTALLADIDITIHGVAGNVPHEGTSYGVPYNLVSVDGPKTAVWDSAKPAGQWHFTWGRGLWRTPDPIVRWPLPVPPDPVRRGGDPGEAFDRHYVGFDPEAQVLYEAIQMQHLKVWERWRTWGRAAWTAGYAGIVSGVAEWDCTKPWDAPGQPNGMTATHFPKFPLVVRWDQIVAAIERDDDLGVGHAMFLVLPNGSPEFVGPARRNDGDLEGFPIRGGELLRARPELIERFPRGSAHRVIAATLVRHGAYYGDRNSWGQRFTDGTGHLSLAQDIRLRAEGRFIIRLSDLDVIVSV